MPNFSELTYQKQIRFLRLLGLAALKRYPFTVKKIKFINYGENATFCVTDTKNCKYLLRICRNDYHTKEAVLEELFWLRNLSKTKKFQLPVPVLSSSKKLLETAFTADIPDGRKVALFRWTEGRFFVKSISEKHMRMLGIQMANLHIESKKTTVKHRRYWNAEGLLGKHAKFGSIDNLQGATSDQQRIITKARKKILKKFKNYELKSPNKMGIIHADLHTGNFLFNKNGIALIDFDDCGFGFFGYDLAIPIMSLDRFEKMSRKRKNILKEAFFSGYREILSWDSNDDRLLEEFITARRLLMLGWLNSRSDNPRLKKYFKGALNRAVKHVNVQLGIT
jgi:Ser/Thr protein kinase RdoA (MazF antagonist)